MGTLVWDRIWHPSSAGPVEQWGGAVYSLAALSAACPAGWQVEPIVKIGYDLFHPALARIGELPNVRIGPGIREVPNPNNRVELRYRDAAHRGELLSGGVPPWTWEELEPLLGTLDALYVNFLSGFELDLDAAERVRRAFRGPIYADLHSLFLGPAGDGPRAPRPLPDWQRWLACFDVVQLNETELSLLPVSRDGDPARLLEYGPRLALVTLGDRGARFAAVGGLPDDPLGWNASASPAGPVDSGVVPPPDGALSGDPTGCGDVWGSVAWTGLLAGLPVRAALERANRAAAAKIRNASTADLHLRLRTALGA